MRGLVAGRRILGPGIILFLSMGAVILVSSLLNAYGHNRDIFDEASDFIHASLYDRLSMVSAAQMSFEAFFASSQEVEKGEFGLYCVKMRKNWPFLRSMEYYAPPADGPLRRAEPLYAYPDDAPRGSGRPFGPPGRASSFALLDPASGDLVFVSRPLPDSLLTMRMPASELLGTQTFRIPVSVSVGLSRPAGGGIEPVSSYGRFSPAFLPFMKLRRARSMEALGREWVVVTEFPWRLAAFESIFMGATAVIGCVFIALGLLLLKRSRELKRREEILMRAERMATATSLVSGIAHDFNNVLTGIVGTLDLLRGILGTGERVECARLEKPLSIMEEAAARAGDMVASLRQVGNEGGWAMERVDLEVCAKAVVELAKNAIDQRVSVEFVDRAGGSAPCLGDRSLIERAILNLVVNAAHSMTVMVPEGRPRGGTVLMTLSEYPGGRRLRGIFRPSERHGRLWQLTVKDSGVGIDHSSRSRVFMPYFSTKAGGTGLGLSMVYSTMLRHSGFIDLESRPGKGTTFFLYFPAIEG